jgi:uncharacterized lipoprotein YmbA
MRPWRRFSILFSLFTVCALGVSSCSFRKQEPTRLYVLTALPQTDSVQPTAAIGRGSIGVGPVSLPQYVNRPQIVTGNASNELQRAEYAQWAEPLERNFTRVLVENLSVLLGNDRVVAFPWIGAAPLDYQIIVEIPRFLGETGGTVSLVVLWSIIGKNGKDVLVSQKSSFSESVGTPEYDALAAAMSRTVAALSREIAAALTTLSRQTPDR